MLVAASCLGVAVLAAAGVVARVHLVGRRRPVLHRRDAIVVLGAKVLADGTASEALEARVAHAVALHRAGHGARLVFSGAGDGAVTEAAVAQQLALEAGVAREACALEDASHSTFDNARRTAKVLEALGLRTVWLVTDDFHVLRAVSHFRRLRIDVEAAPVHRSLPAGRRFFWTAREALGLLRRPWLLG
jgi:uncharacterized SAM-binding protein YcdF (DUF218 family)